MSKAELVVEEILRERLRQIKHEGYTASHDDDHDCGQLAMAAACYAVYPFIIRDMGEDAWPWDMNSDKRRKHNERRRKVIAAALLVAEIERLDREDDE